MATYIRRTAYNALLTPTREHTEEDNLTAIKREVEKAIDAAIEEADWLGQDTYDIDVQVRSVNSHAFPAWSITSTIPGLLQQANP